MRVPVSPLDCGSWEPMLSGRGLLVDAPVTGLLGWAVLCGKRGQGDLTGCHGVGPTLQPRHKGPWPPFMHAAQDFLSPVWSQCFLG